MCSFKDFLEDQENIDALVKEFNENLSIEQKPWSAKKKEILDMWRQIRPNLPIMISPIKKSDTILNSSTHGQDGIRITGSWSFITSVLSRLKDLASYENPNSRLRLVLKASDGVGIREKQAYVFYLNLEERGKSKKKLGAIK